MSLCLSSRTPNNLGDKDVNEVAGWLRLLGSQHSESLQVSCPFIENPDPESELRENNDFCEASDCAFGCLLL